MKTVIVYYSKHHENTKKLIDAISNQNEIDLIDVTKVKSADLSKYDIIGFASGIYYSKFHKQVLEFAQNNLPENKKVFFLYTYGAKKDGYTNAISKVVAGKKAKILGEYGCYGFNTFGPFKLIGGIAKNHPNKEELEEVEKFYKNILI